MKEKQIPPAAFIGVIVGLIVILGAWFFLSNRESTAKIDLKTVDTRDEDPIRPGQPGYTERIGDTPK